MTSKKGFRNFNRKKRRSTLGTSGNYGYLMVKEVKEMKSAISSCTNMYGDAIADVKNEAYFDIIITLYLVMAGRLIHANQGCRFNMLGTRSRHVRFETGTNFSTGANSAIYEVVPHSTRVRVGTTARFGLINNDEPAVLICYYIH
ncbi:hypothetical protein L1987_20396 [Smallanthus sonchifolius]|uniref:Uncharacterized protein n=1 Tax=Smallanthus sonchifolius TaxID=185202 RepID=A0ACB9IR81_9ASTR|nr:hypothetical protein L1987_20396 [Smallanthus sonchifolius]